MRPRAATSWTSSILQPRNSLQFSIICWIFTSITCYTFAVFLLRHSSSCQRDPTSWFFNPAKGYQPIYSNVRRNQGEEYIRKIISDATNVNARPGGEGEHASSNRLTDSAGRSSGVITASAARNSVSDHSSRKPGKTGAAPPGLCVGIPTVARKNARYFRSAVGSLLEGLDASERQQIHLILFVANSDPTIHPAYSEGWMQAVADEVLVYSNATTETLNHVKKLEKVDTEFREKPLFDYAYLMKACLKTGTTHLALLEDDVIAMDGWFHRTKRAIREAGERTALEYGLTDFLYLRLFYTEEFLGWNSENWPTYLKNSIFALFLVAISLLTIRTYIPKTRKHLTNKIIPLICVIHLPLCILLFFAAGRITTTNLLTFKPPPSKVIEMNKYGCCSQGFVFSRETAPKILDWYAEKRIGFADVLLEELGDVTNSPRWAVVPSVLQHVGSLTSKSEVEEGVEDAQNSGRVRSVAESIWNFAFEGFDPLTLREEHSRAVAEEFYHDRIR